MDDPAPADQFHTAGGRTVDPSSGETPVLEANVAGRTVQQHPRDELGTGAKIYGEGPDDKNFRTGADAAEHANAAKDALTAQAQQVKDENKEQVRIETEQTKAEMDARDDPNEKIEIADAKKSNLKDRFAGYKDSLLNRIPQEHKDKANEHSERVRTFLTEEYFPEERRDQFIYRAKKVSFPLSPPGALP